MTVAWRAIAPWRRAGSRGRKVRYVRALILPRLNDSITLDAHRRKNQIPSDIAQLPAPCADRWASCRTSFDRFVALVFSEHLLKRSERARTSAVATSAGRDRGSLFSARSVRLSIGMHPDQCQSELSVTAASRWACQVAGGRRAGGWAGWANRPPGNMAAAGTVVCGT